MTKISISAGLLLSSGLLTHPALGVYRIPGAQKKRTRFPHSSAPSFLRASPVLVFNPNSHVLSNVHRQEGICVELVQLILKSAVEILQHLPLRHLGSESEGFRFPIVKFAGLNHPQCHDTLLLHIKNVFNYTGKKKKGGVY